MKRLSIFLTAILSLTLFFGIGCGKDKNNGKPKETYTKCNIHGIEYDRIEDLDDPDLYYSEIKDNQPVDNGIIVSPYFTMTVDGIDIPVYSTRCGHNLHSFACVVVEKQEKDKKFSLDVVLTAREANMSLYERNPSVVVLPEKRGVTATIKGDTVKAKLNDFGSFTFAFNRESSEGLTVYVYEKDELVVPEGYTMQEIEPGKHNVADTRLTNANTVYVFKSGRHLVSSVQIKASDIWVYFEDGAYLEAYPENDENGEGALESVINSYGVDNIKISGHGLIDFSADAGAVLPSDGAALKGTLSFTSSDNFVVEDIISINSNSWTLCFTACKNVYIEGVMLYGYRTYSDGIMLSDCQDSYVTKCFVRTGDDAMETKSTSAGSRTLNVTYYDNDCWTDKGIGYGVIWETNNDVKNVYFKNCSVGFALSNWHERLGALAIQLGDHYYSVTDVYFEDIEVYRCNSNAVINVGLTERGKTIDNIHFKNIKATNVAGYMFRAYDRDLENKDAILGNFYLENLYRNGVKLTKDNIFDDGSYMSNFKIFNTKWKPEEHVFVQG